MIQHVGLEVRADQLDACLAFWALLGWQEVPVPQGIGDHGRWVARDGFQVHLLLVDEPVASPANHVALVEPDLDAIVDRLVAAGHEHLERTPYWGARRIFTRSPAGHRVELMTAAPA